MSLRDDARRGDLAAEDVEVVTSAEAVAFAEGPATAEALALAEPVVTMWL